MTLTYFIVGWVILVGCVGSDSCQPEPKYMKVFPSQADCETYRSGLKVGASSTVIVSLGCEKISIPIQTHGIQLEEP